MLVKKTFRLTAKQAKKIASMAKKSKVSESEIIREIIDMV